jgi:hypothetical protein
LFLDCPSGHLCSLSTTELIALAKRAVQGPYSWTSCDGDPPTISRQIVLHPTEPGKNWIRELRLLPGGRYILINYRLFMECWDVEEKSLVWKHQVQRGGQITGFAADMAEDGQAIFILIYLAKRCVMFSVSCPSGVIYIVARTALWKLSVWTF